MARLLSETWCLALFLALMIRHVVGSRTDRMDLEVTSNQVPEAFTGSTLRVHEGDRLTLTCSATGADSRRVFWFESTILLMSADRRDAKDQYSSTLVLDPVQAADDGRILACRVDSSTQLQKVTLEVQKITNRGFQLHISANPPEALSSEEIVKVNLGSKLELTCNLQGVVSHRLSWWRGQEQLTPLSEMNQHSATSFLTLDSVGVADHLKTFTCRADGSTIARTVTLEVRGIEDGLSKKTASILEEIQKDPTLLTTGLIIALVCGLLLIIACVIIIKALQTYLQISKIRDQQVKNEQQKATSASSRRSQRKTPAMKQSLKNQILASVALLPQRNATEAGTDNADQRDTNESDPISQDGDKGGKTNHTFVEEV